MIKTAVIFAAGYGKRMENLTQDTPKPLLVVWGKTLLDHILTKVVAYGCTRVIVNTHYLADAIKEHLLLWKDHIPDLIVTFEEKLLDTGGTLQDIAHFADGKPFFAINGDILWKEMGSPTLGYLDQMWEERRQPILALVPKKKAWGYRGPGDFALDDTGHVVAKINKHAIAPYVYGGIQVCDPQFLTADFLAQINLQAPFSASKLWAILIRRKVLFGCLFPDPWYHVGDKDAFRAIAYV